MVGSETLFKKGRWPTFEESALELQNRRDFKADSGMIQELRDTKEEVELFEKGLRDSIECVEIAEEELRDAKEDVELMEKELRVLNKDMDAIKKILEIRSTITRLKRI